MLAPRRFLSICTIAKRPILYRYSLQDKLNISDIRSWEIYADFLHTCVKGDVRDMNYFHDQHVLPYEARLRRESPDLLFLDAALHNPFDSDRALVQIESPIYPRLMSSVEETIQERNGPEKTLAWFKQIRQLR
jgi:hypothetical protein